LFGFVELCISPVLSLVKIGPVIRCVRWGINSLACSLQQCSNRWQCRMLKKLLVCWLWSQGHWLCQCFLDYCQ